MKRVCPRCGSKDTAPIMYGLPCFDDELRRKLNNHEIALGGCCIDGGEPEYRCFCCHKDFGTPPIIHSEQGSKSYLDSVNAIRFSDGGYPDGYWEISIQRNESSINLDVCPNSIEGLHFRREMSEEEWHGLIWSLYMDLLLHEWKRSYNNPDILDGEQWELKINLTDGHKRLYHGSNAFPPLWTDLVALFRPYLQEADATLEKER